MPMPPRRRESNKEPGRMVTYSPKPEGGHRKIKQPSDRSLTPKRPPTLRRSSNARPGIDHRNPPLVPNNPPEWTDDARKLTEEERQRRGADTQPEVTRRRSEAAEEVRKMRLRQRSRGGNLEPSMPTPKQQRTNRESGTDCERRREKEITMSKMDRTITPARNTGRYVSKKTNPATDEMRREEERTISESDSERTITPARDPGQYAPNKTSSSQRNIRPSSRRHQKGDHSERSNSAHSSEYNVDPEAARIEKTQASERSCNIAERREQILGTANGTALPRLNRGQSDDGRRKSEDVANRSQTPRLERKNIPIRAATEYPQPPVSELGRALGDSGRSIVEARATPSSVARILKDNLATKTIKKAKSIFSSKPSELDRGLGDSARTVHEGLVSQRNTESILEEDETDDERETRSQPLPEHHSEFHRRLGDAMRTVIEGVAPRGDISKIGRAMTQPPAGRR